MACKECRRVQNIILGNFSYLTEKYFGIEILKSPEFERRLQICEVCPLSTWMTKYEYFSHIHKYNIFSITSLEDFKKIENLPPQPHKKNRKLFCRLCKCPIESKARVEEEHCSKERW